MQVTGDIEREEWDSNPRNGCPFNGGGRFRLQASVAHEPRDGQGRFVGDARWTHGTETSYRYACRCPDCTAAWRTRMRAYMRRWRACRKEVSHAG